MNTLRAWTLFLVPFVALTVVGVAGAPVQAARAAPRDPTQPPAVFAAPTDALRSPTDTFRPGHLVTVGGVRYVVWNSRRYPVGATIQGARIERISETEVWLRDREGLRKLSVFSGIEKRPPYSAAPVITPTRTSMDGKNGTAK